MPLGRVNVGRKTPVYSGISRDPTKEKTRRGKSAGPSVTLGVTRGPYWASTAKARSSPARTSGTDAWFGLIATIVEASSPLITSTRKFLPPLVSWSLVPGSRFSRAPSSRRERSARTLRTEVRAGSAAGAGASFSQEKRTSPAEAAPAEAVDLEVLQPTKRAARAIRSRER